MAAAREALRRRVLDLAAGLAELRAVRLARRTTARAPPATTPAWCASARLGRRAAAAEAATQLGVHLAALAALAAGVALHARGVIDGPVLVLLPLAVLGLGDPAGGAGGAGGAGAHARGGAAPQPPARHAGRGARAGRAGPGAERNGVRLVDVVLGYGAGTDAVFDGLSLALAPGEAVAVVGASGAGKSTLGDLVARVVDPDAGTVELGGTALTRLRRADRVARVGYLTQRTELFADTIAGNLRVARPQARTAELWQALETAGLATFVAARPHGLDAWVGEAGVRLSGGQARRLALARVVLADTPVVVLDEPLAGLDAETAAAVSASLGRWLEGRTALLLAHEAGALPRAARVLSLHGGALHPAP
ncbi:MAG: ABC transporter ATP-binding protein [Halofilum sp. (in: g-proteobacteria)]|nr:ABC transporter ATP-binding protein [Halofilum sp. (in: g-proteobacteria)]